MHQETVTKVNKMMLISIQKGHPLLIILQRSKLIEHQSGEILKKTQNENTIHQNQ